MNNIIPIEKDGKRVITTAKLAESYGTTTRAITDNFGNNRNRYIEGKHFYCLTGDELKAFKSKTENFGFAPNINKLYLWTEKGTLLHAKSLNTDKAWEVYDYLVEHYFRVYQMQKQDSYMIENPAERARRWAEEYEEKLALEQKIEQDKPLVEYASQIQTSEDTISMAEMAKIAAKNGIKIGRTRLFEFLRKKKILDYKNVPYQRYVEQQPWFEIRESTYYAYGEPKLQLTTRVTPKGQIGIVNLLKRQEAS